jgi:hypothetical protein
VADLGPGLVEASRTPLLGQGYGSRVIDIGPLRTRRFSTISGSRRSSRRAFSARWLWLFIPLSPDAREAREDPDSPDAWLYAAPELIASFAFGSSSTTRSRSSR